MNKLNYEQKVKIAIIQSIISKYGCILNVKDIASMMGLNERSIKNKICKGDKDLPKFTKLKGKHVVMAQDLAYFMLENNLNKV